MEGKGEEAAGCRLSAVGIKTTNKIIIYHTNDETRKEKTETAQPPARWRVFCSRLGTCTGTVCQITCEQGQSPRTTLVVLGTTPFQES
jgi:hypothetical protein